MSSWSVRSASLDNGGSDIGLGVIGHCGSTGGCLGFCHEAVLRLHQANADRHYYRDNDSQLRPAFDINEDAATWHRLHDLDGHRRSEEHTSELQSLKRNSYAV